MWISDFLIPIALYREEGRKGGREGGKLSKPRTSH
jgi:hypothetical protein